MKSKNGKLFYYPKKLIPGNEIEMGLSGYYAGVPDKGYKGHPFKIIYNYDEKTPSGEKDYFSVYLEVKDWIKAEKFRRFPDQWGRGVYTLGYFKMCNEL